MKALRRFAILALSIGTIVSPFCPMVAHMAQASELHPNDSAMAMSQDVRLEQSMSPCCLMGENAHHSDERRAVFSSATVSPCIVPDVASQKFERPLSHREFCFSRPKIALQKFESRSHIKRE